MYNLIVMLFICIQMTVASTVFAYNPLQEATEQGFYFQDQNRDRSITFVGDSLSAGLVEDRLIPGGQGVCWQSTCFVDLVEISMIESYLNDSMPPFVVNNLGFGGATSRDWDPNDRNEDDIHFRLFGENRSLFSRIPVSDIVVIWFGENDAIGFFEKDPISAEQYEAHLLDLAQTLMRVNRVKRVVIVTPPIPKAWRYAHRDWHNKLVEYGDAVRRVCDKLRGPSDLCLLELQENFPYANWDGANIHFNIRGNRYVAEKIIEHLEKVIHWQFRHKRKYR